jgi:hypothetical protein
MSKHNRPAFLDALTPDAILTGTLLKSSVVGRESIIKVVETVGTFYESMTPSFQETVGNRKFLGYEAKLSHGRTLHALIAITKNSDGAVTRLTVNQGPY